MTMKRPVLILALLATLVFGLATWLSQQGWRETIGMTKRASLTAVFLGESRKVLANHFFLKADAYFHGGYYPSVFDNQQAYQTAHFVEDAGHAESKNEEAAHDFLGRPRNWLDRFGRNFYPSEHIHLGDANPQNPGRDQSHGAGTEREILPWMRLAASLDPENPVTYAATAYWLRRMDKVKEAEQFLREGLRAILGNPQILFELGQISYENHKDAERARNVWELSLRRWDEQERPKAEPDIFLLAQILAQIAKLEEETGHPDRALYYLKRLKIVSPFPESIQEWIQRVEAQSASARQKTPSP